ncbi:MAG TPA: hypothetical protein VGQ85_00080 [Candidatus Limnocylindrales bacterium]|nr:hypothetical protein [Candidatus Limnocylindrales bacterium]
MKLKLLAIVALLADGSSTTRFSAPGTYHPASAVTTWPTSNELTVVP